MIYLYKTWEGIFAGEVNGEFAELAKEQPEKAYNLAYRPGNHFTERVRPEDAYGTDLRSEYVAKMRGEVKYSFSQEEKEYWAERIGLEEKRFIRLYLSGRATLVDWSPE